MFAEMAEKKDDSKKFYGQFGKCLKLGVHEYVDRMKEGQNDIYYITGESITAVSSAPFLESLRKKALEIMYTVNPVDEYAVQQNLVKQCLELFAEIADEKDDYKKFHEPFSSASRLMSTSTSTI
jgi:HSP90 family molecular chaperone